MRSFELSKETLLKFIQDGNNIRISSITSKFGVSETTAQKYLKLLILEGKIQERTIHFQAIIDKKMVLYESKGVQPIVLRDK